MKRFIMRLKTMGIAFAMSLTWTKNGTLRGDLFLNGYVGMVLGLIFPWRRNPRSVILHRHAWLEKKQRRLDELNAEFKKLLDSNEIVGPDTGPVTGSDGVFGGTYLSFRRPGERKPFGTESPPVPLPPKRRRGIRRNVHFLKTTWGKKTLWYGKSTRAEKTKEN